MPLLVFRNSKSHAFTLVELMIVIVVLGTMAGVLISLLNPERARGRARDSVRVTALRTIQTALDLYQADKRSYPTGVAGLQPITAYNSLLVPNYASSLPTDPSPGSNATSRCRYGAQTLSDRGFYLVVTGGGAGYYLMSVLETDDRTQACVRADGVPVVTGQGCYCVQN